jgi:hypothetical protein
VDKRKTYKPQNASGNTNGNCVESYPNERMKKSISCKLVTKWLQARPNAKSSCKYNQQ